MPELPKISGKEAIKVLEQLGFFQARQRGSHVVLRKGNKGCTIPLHDSLAVGTLRSALRQAGLDPETFIDEYRK